MKKNIFAASALSIALAACGTAPTTNWGGVVVDSKDGHVVDGRDQCVTFGDGGAGCEAPAAVVVKPTTQQIAVNSQVLFAFDSAQLTAAGAAELDTVSSKIMSIGQVDSVSVVGHTDSRGSDSYNQSLSERRASTVAAYLTAKNVPNVSAAGQGESNPVASNDTDEGRAQNRRVEVHVTGVVTK